MVRISWPSARAAARDRQQTVGERLRAIAAPERPPAPDEPWTALVDRRHLLFQYVSLAVFVPSGPAIIALGIVLDMTNLVALGALVLFISVFGVFILPRFASSLRLHAGTVTLRGPRLRTTFPASEIVRLHVDGPSARRVYVTITLADQRFFRFGPIPDAGAATIAALRAAAPGAVWEVEVPGR